MNHEKANDLRRLRRRQHARKKLRGSAERPRLTVFRSHTHIYAQVIDDEAGRTLASASTIDRDLRGQVKFGGNKDAAAAVGKTLAERAMAAGVKAVRFDRGNFKYHGRVAALADAARAAGLQF